MEYKFVKNKNWIKALNIIPNGNMLFSKRPDMFLPGYWPTYYKKSKKCYIWDQKNRKYIDMIFAVGTNTLGYSNKFIDSKVSKALKLGNMTSLNCFEEYKLAKELLKINKWAGMVKFARSGGEANVIAIRIARSFMKKRTNVAVCGYHGWHDWYLSTNLKSKKNLDKHLNKNVPLGGVSKQLKGTSYSFEYNDVKKLEYLLKNKKIGIIKMEVERNVEPKNNFLSKVCKLSKKYKAVLIFDECTSGFRQSYGGIFKSYKLTPDIVTFGKAIGNGYALTAIVGKKKIMKSAESSFISSTFWSERLGFIAGLATLNYMKKYKTWIKIKKTGEEIKKEWARLADKYSLKIKIFGISSIPQFVFLKNNSIYKTYITQEMLKKNILASNIVYVSLAHSKPILKYYFLCLEKIFKDISTKKITKSSLKTKVAFNTFKRLN